MSDKLSSTVSASIAQVVRVITYPPALMVTAAMLIPIVLVWFMAGFEFSVNESGQPVTIDLVTGLSLVSYLMAGLGCCVAFMGITTKEDVYFKLAGTNSSAVAAIFFSPIVIVGVPVLAVLALYVLFTLETGNQLTHGPVQSVGFAINSFMFFWFGFLLTRLLKNVLVPLAFIVLIPLLLLPLIDRIAPSIGANLPWNLASRALKDVMLIDAITVLVAGLAWTLAFAALSIWLVSKEN